jgi:hypothetical protein
VTPYLPLPNEQAPAAGRSSSPRSGSRPVTSFVAAARSLSGGPSRAAVVVLLLAFPIVPVKPSRRSSSASASRSNHQPYRPGNPIGGAGAGLAWRIPFAENIVWIDKRVLDVDMDRQPVLSTDQRRLEVDAFARYRIVDPLRMYITARSEERLSEALRPILGSEVRNELGKVPFARFCSPERRGVMENVRPGSTRRPPIWRRIIDVGSRRPTCPTGRRCSRRSSGCARRASRKPARSAPRAPSRRRSSAPRPTPMPRAPMPQASARIPLLRFLPGDAVLPDDVRRRRRDGSRGNLHHPVADNDYLKNFQAASRKRRFKLRSPNA